MRIVFLQTVPGSGQVGEVKNVANGYARNYLLPRKLAAPATPDNLRQAEARSQADVRRQARLDAQAREIATKLEGQTVTIAVRVGEQGRLFGAVTSQDIAHEVSRLAGREVDHRQVELEVPIREAGEYAVTVKLSRNVETTVSVAVVPIEPD